MGDDGTLATLRDGYDRIAGGYVEIWTAIAHYGPQVHAFLAAHVRPGTRVLDVGCGPGHLTAELPAEVLVVGFDLSPAMVAAARAARPTGEYFAHDYHCPLPAGVGAFDVVIAVGCLDFCAAPDLVLGHLARVTAPGAALLLTFCARHDGDPVTRPLSADQLPGVNMYLHSSDELRAAFARQGFDAHEDGEAPGYENRHLGLTIPYSFWRLRRR